MTERWRCFVAAPIGEALRASLRSAVDGWRQRNGLLELRWSDPDAWHVTLAFIGPVDPADVPRIVSAVRRATYGRAASVHALGALGAFPSASHATIAWCGVSDTDSRLADLAAGVHRALGLKDQRPFRAHVTLGRARSTPVDLRGWVASGAGAAATLVVDRVELMRSHLGRGPARYEVLAAFPLAVAAHA